MNQTYPINMTYHKTKFVFMANDVPDDVVTGATLAVVTDYGWHIFGAKRAHSFDKAAMPLPEGLTCTVLDISALHRKQDPCATTLLAEHIDGRINVQQLAEGLMALGATELGVGHA